VYNTDKYIQQVCDAEAKEGYATWPWHAYYGPPVWFTKFAALSIGVVFPGTTAYAVEQIYVW